MLCIINGVLFDLRRLQVVRALNKCGLRTKVDGSENQEVYIEKIPHYNMRLNDEEFNEE